MSPVVMAILVLSLCPVFHRFYTGGMPAARRFRRERGPASRCSA